MNKYAITYTTQSMQRASGTSEIIFEPHSKIRRLSTYAIGNRANINIFLCGITNPSYYENLWCDDTNTLNIYSPFENIPFCDKMT